MSRCLVGRALCVIIHSPVLHIIAEDSHFVVDLPTFFPTFMTPHTSNR